MNKTHKEINEAYKAAIEVHQAERSAAIHPLWIAYHEASTKLMAAANTAAAECESAYHAACRPHWNAYVEACMPHRLQRNTELAALDTQQGASPHAEA